MKRLVVVVVTAACIAAAGAGAAVAPAAPDPNAQLPGQAEQKCSLHGGRVSTTRQHCFETVFDPEGVRVFLYAADQNPMPVGKARGTVRFEFKDGSTTEVPLLPEKPKEGEPAVYYCSMHPDVVQKEPGSCPKCGMNLIPQYSLAAKADLAKAKQGDVKAVITVRGLPGEEPSATFTANVVEELRSGAPAPGGAPKSSRRSSARRSGHQS
jgi:hypothetical protein